MNEQLGMCDKRQYEHNGPHRLIAENGQNMPPFPCVNWHRVIESMPPQAAPESANTNGLDGNCSANSSGGLPCDLQGLHDVHHHKRYGGLGVMWRDAPVVTEKTAPIHNDLCDKCLKDFSSCRCRKTAPTLPPLVATGMISQLDERERQLLASEARNQELMGLLSMPPFRAYVFTQIGDEAYYKAEDVRRWFDQLKEKR